MRTGSVLHRDRSRTRRRLEAPAKPQQPEPNVEALPNPYNLSGGEMRVLFLLSNGLTDRQIADALGVTSYTINKHVGAILQKMDVRSRTAAAVRAIREHTVPAVLALAILASEEASHQI